MNPLRSLLPLLLVVSTLLSSACTPQKEAHSRDASSDSIEIMKETSTRVEVAQVETSEARLTMRLPGEVEGIKESLLGSSLGGYVEKVYVSEGEDVQKGAVLADIDVQSRLIQQSIAQTELVAAETEFERLQKLGDLALQSQVDATRVRVKMAKLSVEQATLMVSRSRITAPFSGMVAQINLEQGEVIGPGQPAIRLIQLDPAIVTLSVSDRDITNLEQGMEATVVADARLQAKKGVLRRILPAGDLRTRTFKVEIEIPNSDRSLLPGMIASATISKVLASTALQIPQDYVVTQLDGLGVFVEEDGVAKWRPVEVASVVGNQVVIASGLTVGEKIVITGHRDLSAGDKLLVSRSGTCCVNGKAEF
ncbi:MAG: efflux RND transporter periplasmic adaptor subunit [Myxococcota bacterium]|nr:efflux RND transporter periplasmic adaptor subunit [Myxococcota bacterium]